MAAYRIFFRKSVLKDLEKIPRKDLRKIMRRIKALGENPRPSGCEKLSSRELYRIRQGKYRIVYSIQDDVLTVCVVKVSRRKNAYR